MLFEDEVIFHQSGSTHRTYAKVGKGTILKSEPGRQSIKALGCVSDEHDPRFSFKFAPVFNKDMFQRFLRHIVKRFKGEKVFMILDNARYHHARDIKGWLEKNSDKIELHFLPPYSPNLNPIEKVWKNVKKDSIHNKYYQKLEDLRMTVFRKFNRIQGNPASVRKLIVPNLIGKVQ